MIPHKITLQGSLGIRAGLGLDTLTLDLDTIIPPDARTVAIRGDNGSGKSTLLNLGMVPWAEPASLAGNPYDHFGPQGLRELIWSHGGETYRSRIEYRIGKTKSTRAYLHVLNRVQGHVSQNGGDGHDWQPVILPDNTVSDGKVSTYRACLTSVLGPQELFERIPFRGQGAPKLAEYPDQKDFMREVLGLRDTDEHIQNLKDKRKFLGLYREVEREKVAALDGHQERIALLERELAELADGDASRKKAKFDAIDTAATARAELNKAKEGDIDRQRIREQRAAVAKRLEEARAQARDAATAAGKAVDEAHGRLRAAKNRAAEIDEQIGRDTALAQRQVENNERILAERTAIEAAKTRVQELVDEIGRQEATVEDLRKKSDEITRIADQVHSLTIQRSHVADAGKDAANHLAGLQTRSGFVKKVPCRGEGEYATCPALCDAIQAGTEIDAAEKSLTERRAEWSRIDAQVQELTDQSAQAGQVKDAYRKALDVLAMLRRQIDGYRSTAAKESGLDVAQAHLAEAYKTITDLNIRHVDHNERSRKEINALNEALDEAEANKNTVLIEGDRRVDQVRAELSALPEPEGDSAVILARKRLEDAEEAVALGGIRDRAHERP